MNIYYQNPDFYNHPVRLTKEQKKDPLMVIKDFFVDFELVDSRAHIAAWLECALTKANSQFAEPHQRSMIWTFAERLEELIEAVHILNSKKNQALTS